VNVVLLLAGHIRHGDTGVQDIEAGLAGEGVAGHQVLELLHGVDALLLEVVQLVQLGEAEGAQVLGEAVRLLHGQGGAHAQLFGQAGHPEQIVGRRVVQRGQAGAAHRVDGVLAPLVHYGHSIRRWSIPKSQNPENCSNPKCSLSRKKSNTTHICVYSPVRVCASVCTLVSNSVID